MAEFRVWITQPRGYAPAVDPYVLVIGVADIVEWVSDEQFAIEFEGGTYPNPTIIQAGDKFRSSSLSFASPGTYKYSITGFNGIKVDPLIEVLPSASEPRRPPTGPQRPPTLPPDEDDEGRR